MGPTLDPFFATKASKSVRTLAFCCGFRTALRSARTWPVCDVDFSEPSVLTNWRSKLLRIRDA